MAPAALSTSSHARVSAVSLFRASPTPSAAPCLSQQSTLRLMLPNGCNGVVRSHSCWPPPWWFFFHFISGTFSTNRRTYTHSYRNSPGRGVDNSSRAVCRVVHTDTRFLLKPLRTLIHYYSYLLNLFLAPFPRLSMFSSRPFFLLRRASLSPTSSSHHGLLSCF